MYTEQHIMTLMQTMKIPDASKQCAFGLTSFKKLYRSHRILRWQLKKKNQKASRKRKTPAIKYDNISNNVSDVHNSDYMSSAYCVDSGEPEFQQQFQQQQHQEPNEIMASQGLHGPHVEKNGKNGFTFPTHIVATPTIMHQQFSFSELFEIDDDTFANIFRL